MTDPTNIRFALVITNDGVLVNNTIHATRRERRDAGVAALLEADSSRYVPESDVRDILLTFGGADPDAALNEISVLYAEHGFDVYLEEQTMPADPNANLGLPLYAVVVSYPEKNTIDSFRTAEERADHLRQRLINLQTVVPAGHDEDQLAAAVQQTLRSLIDTDVCVHLVTVQPN
ncbi:hypothetical protein ANMWB30_24890 [Arthrobacter sp. MWB30]|nr:hypothetical protein ANMWB30_24890 [Arthrobacter sp. MWB30]